MEVPVTLIQLRARRDKQESMKMLEKLLEKSVVEHGITAIPEYSMFDPTGLTAEEVNRGAESLDGPWMTMIKRIARSKEACIAATLFEKGEGGKAYNSLAIIDESGDIIATYRKTHLFDALGYRESEIFEAGDRLFEPVEACGVRVGAAICFEIRFPEIFRYQALKGAQLILVPSGWYNGPGKEEQYRFLAQTRAHENTLWIASPILYGDHFTGRSLIVNPFGVVVADAGHGEKVLHYYIGLEEVDEARKKLPVLRLRRPELYSL